MARGGRKRDSSQFNIGHECKKRRTKPENPPNRLAPKYCRLPTDLYDKVNSPAAQQSSSRNISASDSQRRVVLLRPRPSTSDDLSPYLQDNPDNKPTYRILHAQRTIDFFNSCVSMHSASSKKCTGQLQWDVSGEKKWGLCWRERLICRVCGYRSKLTKLYDEVSKHGRGQRSAAPNLGIQVGLTHSSISTTQFRHILQSANIPPPSSSSMQASANRVGDIITEVNKADMEARRKQLQDISELRGLPRDTPINIEGDGRYNNPLFGSSEKTPFQPATQMVYTVCENSTPAKQVISVHTVNKLCKKADMLRKKGTIVTCPDHEGCSANVRKDHTIGDEAYAAAKCAEEMKPLSVDHMTTDGDSQAYLGVKKVQSARRDKKSAVVENLRDPGHLSKTLIRTVEKSNFSASMFPGRTRAAQLDIKRKFGKNLKRRCTAEFNQAHSHWAGDLNRVINSLSYATDAMVSCYGGNCGTLCKKYSFACSGGKSKGLWDKSYLSRAETRELIISDTDEQLLRECISIRLGVGSIKKTKLATTTQKCESVNRTFKKTNPKTVTFSRNFEGRIHSGVHGLNCGTLKSTVIQCAAVGAPLTTGSKVVTSLESSDARNAYHAERHKSFPYKVSRKERREERFELHADKPRSNTYRSGMLDVRTRQSKCDHAYSQDK
jgi:hypothetical protein